MGNLPLLQTVIDAGQDFEWYPTTARMIGAVAKRLPSHFGSLMDIGAGDGRVLVALQADEARMRFGSNQQITAASVRLLAGAEKGSIVGGLMSSRGNAPSLAISGIPPEVLQKALARAKADGWFSKNALFIELLRDYGEGKITPATAPPPFDPTRGKQEG